MDDTSVQYSIYFAGDLFNHKDLTGNALLASFIGRVSEGRYRCVVPQNLEQTTGRAVDIRNQDLSELMQCDLALFNFDGVELDSGTVVEFIYAKMLDIPSVIIRSDFRRSGDQEKEGDDWNLMASFYPRTVKFQFNAMAWYQEAVSEYDALDEAINRYYERIASALVDRLDAVRKDEPVAQGSRADLERLYLWALRFPGGGLIEHVGDENFVRKILDQKLRKGVIETYN